MQARVDRAAADSYVRVKISRYTVLARLTVLSCVPVMFYLAAKIRSGLVMMYW